MSAAERMQREAREAAERIGLAREVGAQLSFLQPIEAPAQPAPPAPAKAGPGRPKGSTNKAKSELRGWLAAKGYRMPEAQLAQLALLDASGDLFEAAMARAEQLVAWSGGLPKGMSRLGLAMEILRLAKGAAEAMMPYGLAKLTPDQVQNVAAVKIVMPGGDARPAMQGGSGGRWAPPPLEGEILQDQEVSGDAAERSDGAQSDDEGKA